MEDEELNRDQAVIWEDEEFDKQLYAAKLKIREGLQVLFNLCDGADFHDLLAMAETQLQNVYDAWGND